MPSTTASARSDQVDEAQSPAMHGRRAEVRRLLRASSEPRSVLSLAGELGVHPNTIRFHLDALVASGDVEQVLGEAPGPGRPPVLFRAARRMDPTGPTSYRLLAGILTHHLATRSPDPSGEANALGRQWAPRLVDVGAPRAGRVSKKEALSKLALALTNLGFAPEPPTGSRDATIRLRHCPFLDLVVEDSDNGHQVICSLHLGLMQGALAAVGGPVTVDRIEPFAEPDLCLAHLAPVRPRSPDPVQPAEGRDQ